MLPNRADNLGLPHDLVLQILSFKHLFLESVDEVIALVFLPTFDLRSPFFLKSWFYRLFLHKLSCMLSDHEFLSDSVDAVLLAHCLLFRWALGFCFYSRS